MASVQKIWMFHTGMAKVHRKMLELGPVRESCWLPVMCFLLIHPNGPVLIDTGLGTSMLDRREKWWGRILAKMVKLTFEPTMDCRSRIRQCGIDPDDIEVGLLTHLHFDHAGAILDLPKTRFYLTRRELNFAWNQRGLTGLRRGYVRSEYREALNLNVFDWSGASGIDPFDVDFDLFGDGSIRAIPTPGHTRGHCSILIRLQEGKEVLLCGDAAFTAGQVEGDTRLGFMPRRFGGTFSKAEESLHRLRAFALRRDALLVLTSHDPEQGDDIAVGPSAVSDF